jgi:HEAT repeat protein
MPEEAKTREFVTELLARVPTQTAIEVVKLIGVLRPLDRPELLTRVLNDPRPSVRRAALRVTENVGGRALIPVLIELLEEGDHEEQDRLRIFHAIAALGGPRAVEYLNQHLGPKKRFQRLGRRAAEFRHQVLLSFGDVADTEVRMFLRQGVASRDKRFAEACRTAIGRPAESGEGS